MLVELHRRQHAGHREVAGAPLDAQTATLRSWQAARLATTYADLLASPRYGPACRFFLDDIYAPRDFTQRDADIKRMHDFMLRFLPARLLNTLAVTIELAEFTYALDAALLEVMVHDLGLTDTITPAMVATGYRMCDNYADRHRQIELIVEVGQGLDRLARLPFIGLTLRLARGPALQAGWHDMQQFLENGFSTFKHMHGSEVFMQAIRQRELSILERIFAGDDDPFTI